MPEKTVEAGGPSRKRSYWVTAIETGWKSVDERLAAHDSQLTDLDDSIKQGQEAMELRFGALEESMRELKQMIKDLRPSNTPGNLNLCSKKEGQFSNGRNGRIDSGAQGYEEKDNPTHVDGGGERLSPIVAAEKITQILSDVPVLQEHPQNVFPNRDGNCLGKTGVCPDIQSPWCARKALEHFNSCNPGKEYDLVEFINSSLSVAVFGFRIHANFKARPKNADPEKSPSELFFTELRCSSLAFEVTACCKLSASGKIVHGCASCRNQIYHPFEEASFTLCNPGEETLF